jgi:cysteine-rich repeat protein
MKKSVLGVFFLAITLILFSSLLVSAGDGFGGKGLENRLRLSYEFDDTTNPTDDSSLWNEGATVQGNPSKTQDRFGGNTAYDLDGVDDYINASDSGQIYTATIGKVNNDLGLTGGKFTIAGWFHFEGDIGTSRLIAKEEKGIDWSFRLITLDGGEFGYNDALLLQVNDANNIQSSTEFFSSNQLLSDDKYKNNWVFIAGSYSNESNSLKVYTGVNPNTVPGEELEFRIDNPLNTDPSRSGILKNTPTYLGIGADGDGGNWHFDGKVDDIKFYDRELSFEELETLFYEEGPSGEIVDDSLIMHFPLDGNADDITGNYQTSILGDAVSDSIGRDNGAYHFDDITSTQTSILVQNSQTLGAQKEITVATWVKLDQGAQNNWQHIVTKRSSGGDPSIDQEWSLQTSAPENTYSFTVTPVGSSTPYHVQGSIIRTREWEHLVGTYDESTSELKIYVNGRLEGTTITNGGDIKTLINWPVVIGARISNDGSTVEHPMNGSVDDVRIYNRALNKEEVYNLYRNYPLVYTNFPNVVAGHTNSETGKFIPRSASSLSHNETLGRTNIFDGNIRTTTIDGIEFINTVPLENNFGFPNFVNVTTSYFKFTNETVYDGEENLQGGSFWLRNNVDLGEYWNIPTPPGTTATQGSFYPPEAPASKSFTGSDLPGSQLDIAKVGYHHGFGFGWNFVYTDGPLGPTRFAHRPNTTADPNINNPTRGGAGTWNIVDLTTIGANHPDQIPSAAYYYRLTNCPFTSEIMDVNDNNILGECEGVGCSGFNNEGSDGWLINNPKATNYKKFYACSDLNGDEVVDSKDDFVMDAFQEREGLSRNEMFTNARPINTEVNLWFTTPTGLGEVRVYNGTPSSILENYTFDFEGLPTDFGPPTLGYFDDLVDKVILWWEDAAYESSDGRNFKLFHGTPPGGCVDDSFCSPTQYCDTSVPNGECKFHQCVNDEQCTQQDITNDCSTDFTSLTETTTPYTCQIESPNSGNSNTCVQDLGNQFAQAISCGTSGCQEGSNPGVNDYCAICGDSVQEGLETCDDGAQNGQPGMCNTTCDGIEPPIGTFCGDGETQTPNDQGTGGLLNDGNEECDDGNNDDGDGCSASCVLENPGPSCGDGIRTTPNEECDGALVGGNDCTTIPGGFTGGTLGCYPQGNAQECMYDTSLCTGSVCVNDGICDVAGGETNSCNDCSCGDGVFEPSSEQCEDGNNDDGDGCSASCIDENPGAVCPNNILEGNEQCDTFQLNGQSCLSQGQPDGTLGCDGSCMFDYGQCTGVDVCGNGICEVGETNSACSSDCFCGDGYVETTSEQCDDGDNDDGDGCDMSCQEENGWVCTGNPSVCTQIPLGLCGELTTQSVCEDSDSWTFNILQSIELLHEAFANENGLDLDFCTNAQYDNVRCGCDWTGSNNCVEFVEIDKDRDGNYEQCFTDFVGGLTGQCIGGETDYTIEWVACSDIDCTNPGDGDASIGCVGSSETFQCPSRTILPFFTLMNVIITLLMVTAIYFVIRKDLEK